MRFDPSPLALPPGMRDLLPARVRQRRAIERAYIEAIRGAVNSARLPAFHQLDVRIDKTFTFNRWQLGLYLDIQNLYNQANTENLVYGGWQLSQVGSVTGIPFFPNLGVRADF